MPTNETLLDSVKRLAEAQKNCWASKWPLERLSDTSLGADTRRMVQVGVTDDGEPIGEVDGGLEPVAEGHKDVLDLLVASLGIDFPALLAHIATQAEALKVAVEALEGLSKAGQSMMDEPGSWLALGSWGVCIQDDVHTALSRIAALTGEKK